MAKDYNLSIQASWKISREYYRMQAVLLLRIILRWIRNE
jgi:hypothetical protein